MNCCIECFVFNWSPNSWARGARTVEILGLEVQVLLEILGQKAQELQTNATSSTARRTSTGATAYGGGDNSQRVAVPTLEKAVQRCSPIRRKNLRKERVVSVPVRTRER